MRCLNVLMVSEPPRTFLFHFLPSTMQNVPALTLLWCQFCLIAYISERFGVSSLYNGVIASVDPVRRSIRPCELTSASFLLLLPVIGYIRTLAALFGGIVRNDDSVCCIDAKEFARTSEAWYGY